MPISKNAFRCLVVFHQLFDFSRTSIENATMPADVPALIRAHAPKALNISSTIQESFDWAMILIGLAAFVGVLLFRGWGRWCYVIYLTFTVITLPIDGDIVLSTRWSFLAFFICAALWGVIATLLFTAPIKNYFERPSRNHECAEQ
jgi:hypothetical protein